MKRFFIAVAVVLLCVPAFALDQQTKFAWDANTVTDEATMAPWQAVEVYQRTQGGQFNYEEPIAVVPQTYTNGASTPNETPMVTLTFPDGANTTLEFTARAKAVIGTETVFSADSNVVNMNVNLTPLENIDFSVAYNDVQSTLDFAWSVTDSRIKQWKVFNKPSDADEFTLLTTLDKEGDVTDISTSLPEDQLFPVGALTTQVFAVVGVYEHGESTTGIQKTITRDRRNATPGVVNFKIVLE